MQDQEQPQQKEQGAESGLKFDPGHVMTRKHYENLAREAAGQK